MRDFAHQPILQVARHFIHREERIRPISAALRQSERAKPLEMVKKFANADHRHQPHFRDGWPIFWRVMGQEAKDVLASLESYRECLSPDRKHLFDIFRPVAAGSDPIAKLTRGVRF